MIKPEIFVKRWQNEVLASQPEAIRDDLRLAKCLPNVPVLGKIPEDSARFLVEAGLPCGCAPFLSFNEIGRGLRPLISVWRLEAVSNIDVAFLSRYHVIGSDGAGNPLCIDLEEKGKIFMVDHDNAFRSRHLVSSSVAQLAEALLIIHTQPYQQFRSLFEAIDRAACEPGSFLPCEVETLIET